MRKTGFVDCLIFFAIPDLIKSAGLANPEEFSFQPDDYFGGNLTASNSGSSSTLSRGGKLAKQKEKDASTDARWLNPEKSLPEQNVTENDMVLLKKKFFYSDINIDRNDPVQLNLLYVQSRDSIISGKYPGTGEEAAQFAAIQLQVQHGNHEPDKHKPGFVRCVLVTHIALSCLTFQHRLDEFLPSDYRKNKVLEKQMYHEHRKLQGMSDLNAKYRYIQLCRSLKTYGVSFFSVKEQTAKKNKMVNVLLGVTKDSVVKLDSDTKAITKSWPLTQLRRWAASPNRWVDLDVF